MTGSRWGPTLKICCSASPAALHSPQAQLARTHGWGGQRLLLQIKLESLDCTAPRDCSGA